MNTSYAKFKKALSVLLALTFIVSSVFVVSVSASAATISNSDNVYTDLKSKDTEVYTFQTESGSDISGAASAGNGKSIPGIASALNCLAGTTNKLYLRVSNRGTQDNNTLAMKWASPTTTKSGLVLGKTGSNIGSGVDQAYVLEDNTTYEVSYDYYNYNGTALSLNVLGVSHASNIVLQDLEDEHTYTVLNPNVIDATSASKAWTTYTCTFTTGTVGSDKYLAFAVFRESTAALEFWADNFVVSKITNVDSADVITFNDNGKTYYAYPDALTELPDGDNGALDSEFLGWYDASGNLVTEVPKAGSVLNAKYPIYTNIPDKVESLKLDLTNSSEKDNISHNSAKGILGVVSASNSSHRIYSRTATIADGTSAYVIKFADKCTSSRSITLGKDNVAANGAAYALVVEPNAKYNISYYIKHDSGVGVSFDILASSATSATSGYVLDSYTPEVANKTWVKHTCEFTAPDAATLGNNQYVQFAITVPEGQAITNVVWLYGFEIVKTAKGSAEDYITLKDGTDVFYCLGDAFDVLPEGKNAPEGQQFLGWYDDDGNIVTGVPEAGAVLTANYGVVKTGILMGSIRRESGSADTYISAGIRFRGRIDVETANKASEIGFIIVPNGLDIDSSKAVKGINKSVEKGIDIVYDASCYGHVDYQVILTKLTKENVESNLCDLKLDVYFYYVIDGVVNYCGNSVSYSYNDLLALTEAAYPTVNNTLDKITQSATGGTATDKLTGQELTLTPPEFVTINGGVSYVDATDNTTLMSVTNTNSVEYKNYLDKLENLGYTAIVGNSRILASSQNFSAIYSDGTNLINVSYIAFSKTVKVTIEPLGFDNVEDINNYLSIFHDASSVKPENAVCDPLFLTVGLSTSENNNDDGYGFYHGLGYIYRLTDGSFVVIDGGYNGEIYDHAGKIYSMLKYYAPDPENIVISAWIMTHAHTDHIYVFKSFAPKYLADDSYNVTLERIIANLPHDLWDTSEGITEAVMSEFRALFDEAKQRGTLVYKAHVGQVYNLPGFTTEILYTMEITAPTVVNKSMSNTSSIVFRTVVEDKSFVYTADATSISIEFINNAYGNKMKSDFVQVPHHGTLSNFATSTYGELEEFYTVNVKPSYVLWPSAEAGMNIYLAKTVESNVNAILGEMLPYDKMIALGNNIEEIKLNSDNIEIKTLEYYEIGYLKTEPIAVSTEEQFKAISDNPRGYYYLTNNIVITEAFDTTYWANSFAGYLDGKGYSVTFANNLSRVCTGSNVGILSNNVQGVIRNISFGTIESPLQIAYSESSAGAMGLFGSVLADVVFDNVKVYADIEHTISSSYGNYVGGFIGRIYHSSGRAAIATFKNCSFVGSYTENKAGNLKVFGGLVGGMTGLGRLNVSGCTVDVDAVGKSNNSAAGVGGVVGRINAAHTVYINDTTVTGNIAGGMYVGGLIGNIDAPSGIIVVSDCVNTAVLNGSSVGDICGNGGNKVTIK